MEKALAVITECQRAITSGASVSSVVACLRNSDLGLLDQKRRELEAVDLTSDSGGLASWLRGIIQHNPLPPKVRTLWFDVPEIEVNPARTMCWGLPQFDPDNTDDDVFGNVLWPDENEQEDAPTSFPLSALERVQEALVVGPDAALTDKHLDRLQLALYAWPQVT